MAGASPEIMASTVAEPLERRLATIAGVNELTSSNYVGSVDDRRPVRSEPRHQRRRARRGSGDPGGARRPADHAAQQSHLSPIQPGGFADHDAVADLGHADPAQLYDSADTVIQQQLSQVNGVGQITLGGGALPSVRVELEPGKLSSYGIGLEDVRAAIAAANADSAKGHIDQGDQRYEVLSNDQASKAAHYRDLVIAYRNGAPVLLHDVAEVEDSNENIRNAGLLQRQVGGGRDRLSDARRQYHQDRRADQEGPAGDRGDPAARDPASTSRSTARSRSPRRWAIPSAACSSPCCWSSAWCSCSCSRRAPR